MRKPKKTATQTAIDNGIDMSKITSAEFLNTASYPEDVGLCNNCLEPLNESLESCKNCKPSEGLR